jgi:hypothetical protein
MCRAAARDVRNELPTAVTIGVMKSSSSISWSGVPCTAGWVIRLNEMSSDPASPATASACASTAPASRASTSAVSALPPAERISSATASSFASVRPARKTRAPSRPNVRATAAPIAPPAP